MHRHGTFIWVCIPPCKPWFGPVFLKCSQRFRARTMSDSAQKCIPLIQNLVLLSWVLIWPNHLWGSSELEPPPGGQSWASLPCGWFWPGSPSAVSVCFSILQHLTGTAQKGEPEARPSTSFRARNLSFFTRDEAFYETKWVSFKWSATKAPWLICLLGYCSCHLWKTSGQQID